MAKGTKYTAKFSNGVVKTRTSQREYRAAWYFEATYTLRYDCAFGKKGDVRHTSNYGFSKSLAQASDNMHGEKSGFDEITFAEVVNVEEV